MFSRRETEVVIAGAGPVGLFTALSLAENGVKIAVFDKDWRTAIHSYALVLHPRSLRLLDDLGLARELIPCGRKIEKVILQEGSKEEALVDLTRLGGDFPFALAIPQAHLESILEERLKKNKIKVHWNHRVQDIRIDNHQVSVQVDRLEKESVGYPVARTEWVINKTFEIDCAFVVGADGYYSRVRRILDLDYPEQGAASTFAAYELKGEESWSHEARVVLNPDSTNVFWPMQDGRCRLGFQVDKEPEGRPDLELLRELGRERMPWIDIAGEAPAWSAIVTFQNRLVEQFGRDRIWLAGDAAHLIGPVGVQSMNEGLFEGGELGGRIGAVLQGKSRLGTLDQYNEDRLAVWKRHLGLENARSAGDGATDWVKKNVTRIPACVPASGEDLDTLLAQIGIV